MNPRRSPALECGRRTNIGLSSSSDCSLGWFRLEQNDPDSMSLVSRVIPRRGVWLWFVVLAPPLFALALWASLWWQWLLPSEDGLGVDVSLLFFCVAGTIMGLATANVGWTRTKAAMFVIAALPLAPAVVIWVISFLFLPVLLLLGYSCYRAAQRCARGDKRWRVPLVLSLCPLLVAIAASLPLIDSHKWLWPWISYRGRIIEFQARTDAAAEQLGLPVGRPLTASEIEAWSHATPLRLHLEYPIIGKVVSVSVLTPWSDQRFPSGLVWAWWGGPGRPTFGALNTRTMTILSASD